MSFAFDLKLESEIAIRDPLAAVCPLAGEVSGGVAGIIVVLPSTLAICARENWACGPIITPRRAEPWTPAPTIALPATRGSICRLAAHAVPWH